MARQLQDFAVKISEKDSKSIEKSDRRRLIAISENVYENNVDPQPVYDVLSRILELPIDKVQVKRRVTNG